ncbi:MAG: sel1 repeat family protein [Alphaproteobacteria bacterium]|nr:sel1 repeat family protein [Alphaproteobacteria bacterium]
MRHAILSIVMAASLLSACAWMGPDVRVDPAQSHMEARAMLGIDMYGRGEFLEALDAIRPWAEQGHSSGMVLIAGMYYQGRGVAKNNINAYMWAELGVIYAKDDEEYGKAIKFRNEIASSMTAQAINQARRRTKDWQPGMPLPPEEETDGVPGGKTGNGEMPVGEEI